MNWLQQHVRKKFGCVSVDDESDGSNSVYGEQARCAVVPVCSVYLRGIVS